MNTLFRAGIGLALISLGFGMPYLEFLGLVFGDLPQIVLTLLQIGLVIAGLGVMVEDYE